jgi:predicted transcriptional regulator
MPWWAIILLVIGACGGVPAFAFLALFGLEMWRERRFTRSLEGRAEMLATRAHRPPHQGFRT